MSAERGSWEGRSGCQSRRHSEFCCLTAQSVRGAKRFPREKWCAACLDHYPKKEGSA